LAERLAYWQKQLQGAPALLELPTDRPRPAQQTFNGAQQSFEIERDRLQELMTLCSDSGATLFMTLLSAYAILLSRYSQQQDFAIGSPVAGRNRSETEDLVGFFVNGLVLRLSLTGNPSFRDFLEEVRQHTLAAYDHQDLPFEALVEALQGPRDLRFPPLAQVGFALQNLPVAKVDLSDLQIEPVEIDNHTAKYDLILAIAEHQGALQANLEYNSDLFDPSTMAELAQHYQYLLSAIVANPDCSIHDLALMPDSGYQELLGLSAESVDAFYPLTTTQRDLALDSVRDPEGTHNNLGYALELPLSLDESLWQQALQRVMNEQPALRTRVVSCEASFVERQYQWVATSAEVSLQRLDWSDKIEQSSEQRHEALAALIYQPFSMDGELLRHYLIRLRRDWYISVFAVHHVLLDGLSVTQHLNWVTATYTALVQDAPLPDLAKPLFADYLHYERQRFDQPALLARWDARLQTVSALDIPVPNVTERLDQTPKILHRAVKLSSGEWKKIRQFCRQQRITPAIYFKTLYAVLLARYGRAEQDFAFTEVLAGRIKGHTQTLGCYYSQVPFIVAADWLSADTDISALFAHMREGLRQLGDDRDFSVFAQRQRMAAAKVRFLFNFYNFPDGVELLDKRYPLTQFVPPPQAGEVQCIVKSVGDELWLTLSFHAQSFDDQRFLERMKALSDRLLTADSVQTVYDLDPLLTDENEPLGYWETQAYAIKTAPPDETVVSLIEAQVLRAPERIAVQMGQQTLSYAALNNVANQLAETLIQQGLTRGDRVGVCVTRSPAMIILPLAILKAGGCYVPMDPQYPAERLHYMREDAQLTRVLSDEDVPLSTAGTRPNPALPLTAEDAVYLIYTSGSTGQPKGAGVIQRGVVNLLQWVEQELQLSAEDRVLIISSFSFDLTQKNLWAPLCCGACVVLSAHQEYDPEIISQTIVEQQISWLNCAPSLFYPLVDKSADLRALASLKRLLLGGEAINMARLRDWLESDSCQAEIINTYGPTECTDIAAFYRITEALYFARHPRFPVPLGQANTQVQLSVRETSMQRTPIGLPGELCIAGWGVGSGYWQQPALTAERFVDNPQSQDAFDRILYRTGDRARYRADGLLDYLGRIDQQVNYAVYALSRVK